MRHTPRTRASEATEEGDSPQLTNKASHVIPPQRHTCASRIRGACSCCFKGSSREATSVEEKNIESQRSDEDGGRSGVDEAASAAQEGPLADDPAQRSASNMFCGFFHVSAGSKLALKLYGTGKRSWRSRTDSEKEPETQTHVSQTSGPPQPRLLSSSTRASSLHETLGQQSARSRPYSPQSSPSELRH